MEEDHGSSRIRKADGTRVFKGEWSRRREEAVMGALREAYPVGEFRVCPFPELSPVDWFYEDRGRVIGVAEHKGHSCRFTRWRYILLDADKWLHLTLLASALQVPGYLVSSYADKIAVVDVARVPAFEHKIISPWSQREDAERHKDGQRSLVFRIPREQAQTIDWEAP